MTERDNRIAEFLKHAGWGGATRAPLAGDASNRRYIRLYNASKDAKAVLMDAPPHKGEGVETFVRIAFFLRKHGFSAPDIYASDEEHGFLLLEDLGDELFARVLERDPALELPLYEAATDLLAELHNAAPPETLAAYDPGLMTNLAALAFDWYLKGAADVENSLAKSAFCAAFEPILNAHCPEADVLIQRDYHAENLLWLPGRKDAAKVGLLDFQDALKGHRAYDLVSLLQDARRDVSADVEATMLKRYIGFTGQDKTKFTAAYRVLGVQRNLRIVGVFARLCMRDGKPNYVDLIPRVWAHLGTDLQHDALAPVRSFLSVLPEPSPDTLNRIKAQCAEHPKP